MRGELGDGPERVVPVAVRPAGDQHRRALDPLVARTVGAEAHRPAAPVVAVRVLPQPGQHPRLVGREPAPPLVLPAVAPDRRHGRQHAHRRHVVVVVDEVDQPQRAAAPVHVVGPPVVGREDREDRLQLGRSLAGELQRVEAGVRRAEHADLAVAPLLRRPARRSPRPGRAAPRAGTRRSRRPTTSRCRARRAGRRRTRTGRAGPRSPRRTTTSGRPCGRAAPRAGTAAARRPRVGQVERRRQLRRRRPSGSRTSARAGHDRTPSRRARPRASAGTRWCCRRGRRSSAR